MASKITQSDARNRDREPPAVEASSLPRDAWWLLGVAGMCVVLALGGESVTEQARYERQALEAGQLWRLLSAHLAHLGWSHLALNLAALALLRSLLGPGLDVRQWALLYAMAALSIGGGLYIWSPETQWYVGLSGVLHAVAIVVGANLLGRDTGLGTALLIGILVKLVWEQALGPSTWSLAASGGPVVVDSHLYGALAGLASLPALRWLRRPGQL